MISQTISALGESTLAPLSFPGSDQTYSKYEDFLDAINQVHDGQTYRSYDNYRQQQVFADFSVERDTLGGILRPMAGVQVAYYDIGDYSGETHDGAVIQTTHLRSDYNAGRIKGFNGGWDNSVRLGLTYDTRDFAPNPSNGLFLQAIGRASLKAFGSSENYGQFKLEARGFYSPFPGTRLVLAGRLGYLAQTSNTPFYILSQAPEVDTTSEWLGGFDSLRGFLNNRFVGNNVAVASASARWFFAKSTLWNQNLAYGATAFVDSGSVFNSVGDTSFKNWKVSGGVGFLLSWNVSTVVSFDLGSQRRKQAFLYGTRISLLSSCNTAKLVLRARYLAMAFCKPSIESFGILQQLPQRNRVESVFFPLRPLLPADQGPLRSHRDGVTAYFKPVGITTTSAKRLPLMRVKMSICICSVSSTIRIAPSSSVKSPAESSRANPCP